MRGGRSWARVSLLPRYQNSTNDLACWVFRSQSAGLFDKSGARESGLAMEVVMVFLVFR